MSKLYEINLEKEKSTLYVKASGFFKAEDAQKYVSEFQATVKTINPSSFKLIVDASEQKTVLQDVVNEIKDVLSLYSSVGFKSLVIVNPTSAISKMQIQNSAKEINFKGTFANTVEEAYSL